jgi:hypothetical protein
MSTGNILGETMKTHQDIAHSLLEVGDREKRKRERKGRSATNYGYTGSRVEEAKGDLDELARRSVCR